MNNMNFFHQLASLGNVDMTIRIMQKGSKLTLNILPGTGSAAVPPIIVTGTPSELDEGFFKEIAPAVSEISGIVSNIEEVKKEVKEKTDKPTASKKETPKKSEKKKEAAPAAPLFGETQETNNEETPEDDQE